MSESFLELRGSTKKNSNGFLKQPHRKINRAVTEYSLENFGSKKQIQRESQVKHSQLKSHKSFMDVEEVQEQNVHLKKFVNELRSQLAAQRCKMETQKKKTHTYSRQMSRQFEKELYYSGANPNGHLISGIKHKYEQMKELYEQKCEECRRMQMNAELSNLQEVTAYCEALQTQNKALLREQQKARFGGSQQNRLRGRANKSTEFLDEDLNLNRNRVEVEDDEGVWAQRVRKEKQRADQFREMVKELQLKVQFLERLLIEKDNQESHARLKLKKVQREIRDQIDIEKQLRADFNSFKLKSSADFEKYQEQQVKKFMIERQIFEKSIQEKTKNIEKLQKQIRFMSTLLSYWKPADEGAPNKTEKASDILEKSEKESIGADSESFIFKGQGEGSQSKAQRESVDLEQPIKRAMTNDHANSKEETYPTIRSQGKSQLLEVKSPQGASVKHKETGVKCRKVSINEISSIGELLKYRLIGYKQSIDAVKQRFNFTGEDTEENKKRQAREYITMGEVEGLLQKHPFLLQEKQAHLLARYIVEDCPNEYVYCDRENQIGRSIAQSIIKAFVPQYCVDGEDSKRQEWGELMKTYSANMQLALKSLAPKGAIQLRKYLQLLSGLGIEAREDTKDWSVGQMIKGSESLELLKYEILFQ